MNRLARLITMLLAMHALCASAQWHAVFTQGTGWSAALVDAIDSIKITQPPLFDVYFNASQEAGGAVSEPHAPRMVSINTDTLLFSKAVPDTLSIRYEGDAVTIHNPRLDCIRTEADGACVTVTATGRQPFVCEAAGSSADGRLIIDSDTTFTLVLSGLDLTSQKASAVSLPRKQKARIVLTEGTTNTLSDAATYQTDSTDTSNGCLYAKGSITFSGNGTLSVTGNSRHAISSGKNITVEDGHIIIHSAEKDGLHCDKLQMDGGRIALRMATDASKGIKCKESFTMTGGSIAGEATGNVTIEDGETTYCTLLKSNGTFTMTGGEMTLTHLGLGGRCISVDGNMTIAGGTMNLECHGDGGSYLDAANDSDYFTPKCITVDDSLFINGGTVNCLSTGLGGKGIVSGNYLAIGTDGEQGPTIRVETMGECIVNNEDEDQRFGCPKGIKAGEMLRIYGGDITVKTAGMGGEGIESNGQMLIYGGTLECNTFDDGINVADSIVIAGGQVYCNSVDNDGIDSNGSITISGGIVASVNQNRPNESFDAVKGLFRIKGGIVFGIGSGAVEVKISLVPCYSTPYDEEISHIGGLILTEGKYICVMDSDKVIMALRNENQSLRTFLTVSHPSLLDGGQYHIREGDLPIDTSQSLFDKKMVFGGHSNKAYPIVNIQAQTNY